MTSGDQRLPHDSGNPVAHNTLAELGVIYKRIEIDNNEWEKEIGEFLCSAIAASHPADAFAKERNYKNVNHGLLRNVGQGLTFQRDQITVTPEGLGEAYEAKIKSFFAEYVPTVVITKCDSQALARR